MRPSWWGPDSRPGDKRGIGSVYPLDGARHRVFRINGPCDSAGGVCIVGREELRRAPQRPDRACRAAGSAMPHGGSIGAISPLATSTPRQRLARCARSPSIGPATAAITTNAGRKQASRRNSPVSWMSLPAPVSMSAFTGNAASALISRGGSPGSRQPAKALDEAPADFAHRYGSRTADLVAINGIPNAARVAVKFRRRVIHRYS